MKLHGGPNVARGPDFDTHDLDQHGPGFEAQRRPLVTSGKASGPKCSRQN